MHNQGSNQGQSYLCFPELRSRQRGKETSCRPLDARVVATLTRHQVRETGSRARAMLSSPASIAHTLAACSPTFLSLLSARVPLCSPVAAALSRRSTKQGDTWRPAGDKLVLPHTPPHKKRATDQRAAARCPLPSVPRHATQREAYTQRTLASTPSTPVGRPMLRPEALPSYYQWPPSPHHVRLLTALQVQLLTGLSGVLAPIHIIDLYGPVCVGTTHYNASDSLLKSTGRPSERLDRRRGQRARSRFRVPAEVYAGASYLKELLNCICRAAARLRSN